MKLLVVWIPIISNVSALPPYNERVLVTRIYGQQESTRLVDIARRHHTDQNGEWWQCCGEDKPTRSHPGGEPGQEFRVVAWAPLPSSYK